MGVGGQRHAPAALPPGKRPGTHCTGGWVGPRAGLDGCGKSRPPPPPHTPGFDLRTVQPLGSRYTDFAIPARMKKVWVGLYARWKEVVTLMLLEGTVRVTLRWRLVRMLVNKTMDSWAQEFCRHTGGQICTGSVRSLCRCNPENRHAFRDRAKAQLYFSLTSHSSPVLQAAPQMKTQLVSIYKQTTFGPLEPLVVENRRRSCALLS